MEAIFKRIPFVIGICIGVTLAVLPAQAEIPVQATLALGVGLSHYDSPFPPGPSSTIFLMTGGMSLDVFIFKNLALTPEVYWITNGSFPGGFGGYVQPGLGLNAHWQKFFIGAGVAKLYSYWTNWSFPGYSHNILLKINGGYKISHFRLTAYLMTPLSSSFLERNIFGVMVGVTI